MDKRVHSSYFRVATKKYNRMTKRPAPNALNPRRGRPPLGDSALSQATRSARARAARAGERSDRTRALAAALRNIVVDATDPASCELLAALADALVGVAIDLHAGPVGVAGDAGIRAAVRAVADAVAGQLDDDATAGLGAVGIALDQIATMHVDA